MVLVLHSGIQGQLLLIGLSLVGDCNHKCGDSERNTEWRGSKHIDALQWRTRHKRHDLSGAN